MCIRFFAAAVFLAQPVHAQVSAPELQLAEDLRIAATDANGPLSLIGDATVSRDGRDLFVTQPLDHVVRVFDALTGEFLRSVGREGAGPGEFHGAAEVGWVADTLYVTDRQLRRVSLFTANGHHLGTTRVASPLQTEAPLASRPVGVTSTGKVISELPLPSPSLSEGTINASPWALLERDGRVIATLALRDLRETAVAVASPQGRVVFEQPLSQRNYLALHPEGTSMAVVSQPAGRDLPGSYEVTRLTADGTPLFTRRFSYTPRPVSSREADEIREEYLRRLEGRPAGPQARAAIAKYISIPPFHPPVAGVIVGRDDTVWLNLATGEDAATKWLVLGPDGDPDAVVRAPAELELLHAEHDTVWAAVNDDAGPPSLVRLRMDPSR